MVKITEIIDENKDKKEAFIIFLVSNNFFRSTEKSYGTSQIFVSEDSNYKIKLLDDGILALDQNDKEILSKKILYTDDNQFNKLKQIIESINREDQLIKTFNKKALELFELKDNNFEKLIIDNRSIYTDKITNTIYVIDTTQIKLEQSMFFFGYTEKEIACIKKLNLNPSQSINLDSLKKASIVANSLASNGAEKSIESLILNINDGRGESKLLNLPYNYIEENGFKYIDPNDTTVKTEYDNVGQKLKDDECQEGTNNQSQGGNSKGSNKVKGVSNKEKAIIIFSALLAIGGLVIILTELSLIGGISMIVGGVLTFTAARCYCSYNESKID